MLVLLLYYWKETMPVEWPPQLYKGYPVDLLRLSVATLSSRTQCSAEVSRRWVKLTANDRCSEGILTLLRLLMILRIIQRGHILLTITNSNH